MEPDSKGQVLSDPTLTRWEALDEQRNLFKQLLIGKAGEMLTS